jgi:hypothetical protein
VQRSARDTADVPGLQEEVIWVWEAAHAEVIRATTVERLLRKTSRSGMCEPRLRRQTQAQRVHHDEKLHDLRGSLQGQEARGRPGRKGHGALPQGGGGHDDLWLALPPLT